MTNEHRAAWLEGRRTGIGGSDVAAVLGLNPWKTPLDVWNDKLGLSEDKGMSEPAYWGTVLEDTVAKEFSCAPAREFKRFLTSSLIRKLLGRLQTSTERLSILRLREKFGRY